MAMQSLHQRQLSILRHVTNPRSFNGEPEDRMLAELGSERLRLIGNLSLGKRMEKIRSVFPRSFEYLAHDPRVRIGDFVDRFPPRSATRLDNAVQFSAYLHDLWRDAPVTPEYLPDVLALELALAAATTAERDGPESAGPNRVGNDFRVADGLQLVRCRFDIRVLFDGAVERTPPVERDVCLAVVAPAGDPQPRVFELADDVFDFVRGLATASAPRPSRRRLEELFQLGILEVLE